MTTEPSTSDSVTAEPSTTVAGPESYPVAEADWEPCGDGLQCATVEVPLDHDNPTGPVIDLALIRVPAPAEAVGSIFVNLGGPGGSAVNSVRSGFRLDRATMAQYHLVGFDPRGIGASSPLTCTVDLTTARRPDFSPDSPTEQADLDAEALRVARQCGASDRALLPHIGTDSVIRDLDLLRQAVGDEQLHYIGLSYGTVIGLRYAERYPSLVGHLVLDGVVDPSFSLGDLLRQQAIEFERAFRTVDAACGTSLVCPEGGIAAAFDRIVVELDAAELEAERTDTTATDGVGSAEFQIATLISMYSEGLWPRYGAAVADAVNGDFRAVERLHDLYLGGTSFAAYLAVSCVDTPSPDGAEGWDALVADLQRVAPRFGAAIGNEMRSCAYWPAKTTERPRPVTARGSNPILVASTTGDAPTPLANAVTVVETLDSAGLVVTDDEGHTAYGKSECVQLIVSDYFLTGRVPDELHRC